MVWNGSLPVSLLPALTSRPGSRKAHHSYYVRSASLCSCSLKYIVLYHGGRERQFGPNKQHSVSRRCHDRLHARWMSDRNQCGGVSAAKRVEGIRDNQQPQVLHEQIRVRAEVAWADHLADAREVLAAAVLNRPPFAAAAATMRLCVAPSAFWPLATAHRSQPTEHVCGFVAVPMPYARGDGRGRADGVLKCARIVQLVGERAPARVARVLLARREELSEPRLIRCEEEELPVARRESGRVGVGRADSVGRAAAWATVRGQHR
eukprot:7389512-Prymnesium_polylepis.3